jgi:cytochrome P450/NADPH-cytochrome P450 reductase
MSIPIPQPPTIPFIGNVTALDKDVPLRSFQLLAKTYGEIYQLDLLGWWRPPLQSMKADESRFQ